MLAGDDHNSDYCYCCAFIQSFLIIPNNKTLVLVCSISLLLTAAEATVVDLQGEKNPLANRMPNMDEMGY